MQSVEAKKSSTLLAVERRENQRLTGIESRCGYFLAQALPRFPLVFASASVMYSPTFVLP